MVSQTTTNGINPANINNEKKHWWITIQLARLLNYLSSTRIVGRIIPKRLSDWAKNVLGLNSNNMATNSEKSPSQSSEEVQVEPEVKMEQDVKLEPEVEGEDKGIQTDDIENSLRLEVNDGFIDDNLPDMEDLIILKKEIDELQAQALSQKNLQLELDELKNQLTGLKDLSEQLPILTESLQELKQEREKLEKDVKELKKNLTIKEGEITEFKKRIEKKE